MSADMERLIRHRVKKKKKAKTINAGWSYLLKKISIKHKGIFLWL